MNDITAELFARVITYSKLSSPQHVVKSKITQNSFIKDSNKIASQLENFKASLYRRPPNADWVSSSLRKVSELNSQINNLETSIESDMESQKKVASILKQSPEIASSHLTSHRQSIIYILYEMIQNITSELRRIEIRLLKVHNLTDWLFVPGVEEIHCLTMCGRNGLCKEINELYTEEEDDYSGFLPSKEHILSYTPNPDFELSTNLDDAKTTDLKKFNFRSVNKVENSDADISLPSKNANNLKNAERLGKSSTSKCTFVKRDTSDIVYKDIINSQGLTESDADKMPGSGFIDRVRNRFQSEQLKLMQSKDNDLDTIRQVQENLAKTSQIMFYFSTKVAEQSDLCQQIADVGTASTNAMSRAQGHLQLAKESKAKYRFHLTMSIFGMSIFLLVLDFFTSTHWI